MSPLTFNIYLAEFQLCPHSIKGLALDKLVNDFPFANFLHASLTKKYS